MSLDFSCSLQSDYTDGGRLALFYIHQTTHENSYNDSVIGIIVNITPPGGVL